MEQWNIYVYILDLEECSKVMQQIIVSKLQYLRSSTINHQEKMKILQNLNVWRRTEKGNSRKATW